MISAASTITGTTITGSTLSSTGNVNTVGIVGTGNISTTGNISGGNLIAAGLSLSGNVLSAINTTANITTTANISGSYILGNGSLLTGIDATSIQNGTSNVRVVSSGGNVAIGVGGTSNVAVFATTGEFITGLLSVTGNITGGNILGGANVNATTHTGTTVSVSANITGGNLLTAGLVSATANITGGNILTGGIVSSAGNIIGGTDLYIGSGAASTAFTNPIGIFRDNGTGYVQVAVVNATGTASADLVTYGNNGDDNQSWMDMGFTGNIFNDTNYSITGAGDGYLFAQGNAATGGNMVLATGNTGTTRDIVFSFGFLTANEFLRFQRSTNTILPAANTTANIGSTARYLNNLYAVNYIGTTASITGNITGGNLLTGGLISSTGNITGSNMLTGGLISATGNITAGALISASGNITASNITAISLISGTTLSASSNILTAGLISATGNITGGNILGGANVNATTHTGTTVSVTANITGGNLLTGGLISSTGNITGGNVNTNQVVGTGLTLVSTGDLTLSATGNINANNEYINNVPQPQQNADAANKQYVDNLVSTAISYHLPVVAATITTLATATGGTITYTQPNGVANGVGATLTTTGSFNLIDTANIQTIGARVLVKDQANAVQNGVYTWANATAIVRATDADTYGAGSPTQLGINDYFFVQSGNVNAGSAYIVNAPSGTITFGTSNITFAEFSKSQIYSANTSAGVSLNGTVINALVDNVTTAFSLGNIVVKTSAQLTTPNIGAATGTSLSTTANITGGNILTGGTISATGNITGGNILGGANVNATTHTGATVSVTANITGGNILTGGQLISSVATGTAPLAITSTTLVPNLYVARANVSDWDVVQTATTGTYYPQIVNAVTGNVQAFANTNLSFNAATGVLTASGYTTAGTVTAATVNAATIGNASAVVNGATVSITGTVTAAAVNAAAIGNTGAVFTGASISAATIGNASAVHNGATFSASGTVTAATVNAAAIGNTGATLTGTLQTAAQTNITSVGTLTGGTWNATSISTTYTDAKVTSVAGRTGAVTLAQADISGLTTGSTPTFAGLTVGTGSITGGNIINGNGNGIGNIGSSTVYFNTVFGKATTAQYADLAENYAADAEYTSGTVLEFGGANEVTLSVIPGSARIAGVVSTNPAHLMNSTLESEFVAAVALTGRVPTSVVGTVRKGDMMVSAGNGAARACATPAIGSVIGKALENFNGESGVIEIVVGRL